MEVPPTLTLSRALADMIAREGPLTFARYVETVLYDPEHGYYASRVPGRGVDYETSSSLGPWFGRFVAKELARMWEALGRPDPFTVIEFGAGLGGLAAAAIPAAGEMSEALDWRIVEQFGRIAGMQEQSLGRYADHVSWGHDFDGPAVTGCVLANEVLDNFPFHVFQLDRGEIAEVYVDSRDGELTEVLGPVSVESLVNEVLESGPDLREADRFEIVPGLDGWCRDAACTLDRGYLFTVDYGDEEPGIFERGPGGTLATYGEVAAGEAVSPRRGYRVGNALADPGRRDVTADVNFTALGRAAEAAGFDFELLALQAFWLQSVGIDQEAADMMLEVQAARSMGWHDDARKLLVERRRMLRLADRNGLGGCLVFRASKGFEASP